MSIHYKFKSSLVYDTVTFNSVNISLIELKKAILKQKSIGKSADFDLQIVNSQTKEMYVNDTDIIPRNSTVIVARIPVSNPVQHRKTWDSSQVTNTNNIRPYCPTIQTPVNDNLLKSGDLLPMNASEKDIISAKISKSTQEYDPINYQRIRGMNQVGPVPANYRCYKCHKPGHWIKDCTSSRQEPVLDIKKSTGIPRSFMVPVDGPQVPGAMMTPTGGFAVPALDLEIYTKSNNKEPVETTIETPVQPEIPEDLICTICKDLLVDAVMIPCCGNSYCDECIRTLLLESEDNECPDCHEKDISPDTLIPNRYLRNSVTAFKNDTGYQSSINSSEKRKKIEKRAQLMEVTEPEVKVDVNKGNHQDDLIISEADSTQATKINEISNAIDDEKLFDSALMSSSRKTNKDVSKLVNNIEDKIQNSIQETNNVAKSEPIVIANSSKPTNTSNGQEAALTDSSISHVSVMSQIQVIAPLQTLPIRMSSAPAFNANDFSKMRFQPKPGPFIPGVRPNFDQGLHMYPNAPPPRFMPPPGGPLPPFPRPRPPLNFPPMLPPQLVPNFPPYVSGPHVNPSRTGLPPVGHILSQNEIINNPVEVFERILKEKDERNRILKESRRRHSRSPKSSYSGSRSRSSSYGISSRSYSSRSRSRSLSPIKGEYRHRGRRRDGYRSNRAPYARSRSRTRSPSNRYSRRRRHRSKSISGSSRYYNKDRYDDYHRRGRGHNGSSSNATRRYEDATSSHYSRSSRSSRNQCYVPVDDLRLHMRYAVPYNSTTALPPNYPGDINNFNIKQNVINEKKDEVEVLVPPGVDIEDQPPIPGLEDEAKTPPLKESIMKPPVINDENIKKDTKKTKESSKSSKSSKSDKKSSTSLTSRKRRSESTSSSESLTSSSRASSTTHHPPRKNQKVSESTSNQRRSSKHKKDDKSKTEQIVKDKVKEKEKENEKEKDKEKEEEKEQEKEKEEEKQNITTHHNDEKSKSDDKRDHHKDESDNGEKIVKKAKKDKKKRKKEKKNKKNKKLRKDKYKEDERKSKKSKKDKDKDTNVVSTDEKVSLENTVNINKMDNVNEELNLDTKSNDTKVSNNDWDIEEKSKLELSDDILYDVNVSLALEKELIKNKVINEDNEEIKNNNDNEEEEEKVNNEAVSKSTNLSIYDDLDLDNNTKESDDTGFETPPLPINNLGSNTPVICEENQLSLSVKDRMSKEKLKVKLDHLLDDVNEESTDTKCLSLPIVDSVSNVVERNVKNSDIDDILLLFDKDITESIDKNLSNNKSNAGNDDNSDGLLNLMKSDVNENDFMLEKIKESNKLKDRKDRSCNNDEATKQQKCKYPIFAKAIDAIRQPKSSSVVKKVDSSSQIILNEQKILNLLKNDDNAEQDDKSSNMSKKLKISRTVLTDSKSSSSAFSTKRLSVKDRLGDKVPDDDSVDEKHELNRQAATISSLIALDKPTINEVKRKHSHSRRRSRSTSNSRRTKKRNSRSKDKTRDKKKKRSSSSRHRSRSRNKSSKHKNYKKT